MKVLVEFPLEATNDLAFHVESYKLKTALGEFFQTPARFATDDYIISHGKTEAGVYYFKVYFADRTRALLFKLSYQA